MKNMVFYYKSIKEIFENYKCQTENILVSDKNALLYCFSSYQLSASCFILQNVIKIYRYFLLNLESAHNLADYVIMICISDAYWEFWQLIWCVFLSHNILGYLKDPLHQYYQNTDAQLCVLEQLKFDGVFTVPNNIFLLLSFH